MKLVSGTQMKKIDKKTIKDIGIPGIVLMENAAIKAVQQIEQSFKSINNIKVVVICGKGNNGGDGFAISRHLYNKGADVTVINLYDKSIIKGDALTNLTIIENMGIKIMYADETEKLQKIKQIINSFDLIIDAILVQV